jgi:hypothetical protein
MARHLKLRSFGHDLHGLLIVIVHLSRMRLSSLRVLGPWSCLENSSLLPIGCPTSCPTCIYNIFITMNTSCIELSTSVTLPSKFFISFNLVTTSLILDMVVLLTILACGSCLGNL